MTSIVRRGRSKGNPRSLGLCALACAGMLALVGASSAQAASPWPPPFSATGTSTPTIGDGPSSVAVGDFSGNGPHDLAVILGGDESVFLLLNDGHGHFTSKPVGGTGSLPSAIVAGNFGGVGPGKDIAEVNALSNDLTVFRREPTSGGVAYIPTSYPTGSFPRSMAAGDLTGDGLTDIAVGNDGDGSVTLFLRDASDTGFTSKTITGLGDPDDETGPVSVAIGHLQGPRSGWGRGRKEDLAVLIAGGGPEGELELFLSHPHDSGYTIKTFDVPADADSVAIGDLGGSGQGSDLAVGISGPAGSQGVELFLHDRNGPTGYTTETLLNADPYDSDDTNVAIGDLGGSGRPGVAMTSSPDDLFEGDVSVFVRDSTRGPFKLTTLPLPGNDADPSDIAIGDLSGNGKPDLVTTDEFTNDLSLFTNTTPGWFGLP